MTELGWLFQARPSKEEAIHVLYAFDKAGYSPGGFIAKLVEAMIHADRTNIARFRGFEGYAAAVHAYKNLDDGRAKLYEIAGLK